jgi:Transposase
MSQFYAWLGNKKSSRIRVAVMDMWKPFRLATNAHAPQAATHCGATEDDVGKLKGKTTRRKHWCRLTDRGRPALAALPSGEAGVPEHARFDQAVRYLE